MAKWIRIHPPMPGTRVPSLVQEDSMCTGAAKLVNHTYWSPRALESVLRNERNHHNERPSQCNQRKPTGNSEDPVHPINKWKAIHKAPLFSTSYLSRPVLSLLQVSSRSHTDHTSEEGLFTSESNQTIWAQRDNTLIKRPHSSWQEDLGFFKLVFIGI